MTLQKEQLLTPIMEENSNFRVIRVCPVLQTVAGTYAWF